MTNKEILTKMFEARNIPYNKPLSQHYDDNYIIIESASSNLDSIYFEFDPISHNLISVGITY